MQLISDGADLGAAPSAAMLSLEPAGADHSPLDDIEELEADDGEGSPSEDHGGNVLCEPLPSMNAALDALPHANPVMDPAAPEPATSVACRSSPHAKSCRRGGPSGGDPGKAGARQVGHCGPDYSTNSIFLAIC